MSGKTVKVTDEMLMAYVDGELDSATAEAVARVLADDQALAARADAFSGSALMARRAFAGVLGEAPPARLVDAVQATRDENVVPFPRKIVQRARLPLAASIALAVGLGSGFWLNQTVSGPTGETNGVVVQTAIAEALTALPAGQPLDLGASAPGTITVVGSYPTPSGMCRSFGITDETGNWSGVGCDHGDGFGVDMLVAAGGDGGFSIASDRVSQAIGTYLQSMDAGAPLSPEQEAERLDR